jgi:hypothetical protein
MKYEGVGVVVDDSKSSLTNRSRRATGNDRELKSCVEPYMGFYQEARRFQTSGKRYGKSYGKKSRKKSTELRSHDTDVYIEEGRRHFLPIKSKRQVSCSRTFSRSFSSRQAKITTVRRM